MRTKNVTGKQPVDIQTPDFSLKDTFRLHGTKTGRYLLLFEKALLITKRRSDGTFSWKATVMVRVEVLDFHDLILTIF